MKLHLLQTDNKAVATLSKRIEDAMGLQSEPSQEAISCEEFFMGIAILSTKRPGQYDRRPDLAVKSKTQHTHVVTTTIIII